MVFTASGLTASTAEMNEGRSAKLFMTKRFSQCLLVALAGSAEAALVCTTLIKHHIALLIGWIWTTTTWLTKAQNHSHMRLNHVTETS